jgi:hypothetical protein
VKVQPVSVEEERSSSPVFGWALSYAARGLAVFPLRERSKIPATEHGCKDATTALDMIAAWWTAHPRANVGVATGEASNLAVIDIDGAQGERSLAELSIEADELIPDTWMSVTGRGCHLWFRHDGAPTRNSAGKLGKGLDVRSDGGYVVAPPSVHPGGTVYTFVGDRHRKLQPSPSWLQPPQNEPLRAMENPSRYVPGMTGRGDRYVRTALEAEVESVRVAPVGSRNERLNRASYAVARFCPESLSAREAGEALLAAALAAGLPASEARRTIASGFSSRGAA